jgi:hypothetical protein
LPISLSDILLMARAFKTRYFARWMRKSGLSESALRLALKEMQAGLVDADLGGGLFKKRVALPGRGRRGGARTVIVSNLRDRYFFVLGFAKNEQENIAEDELDALRRFGAELLARSGAELDQLKVTGALEELE